MKTNVNDGGEDEGFPWEDDTEQRLEGREGGGEEAAVSRGREAQAVGIACAKALRQEGAWCISETTGGSVAGARWAEGEGDRTWG